MPIKLENNSGHDCVLKPLGYQYTHICLFGVGRGISLANIEVSL